MSIDPCIIKLNITTQQTLTKYGPKEIKLPLVGGLYHTADFDQMWPKILPLIGGLYHTADFGQMWSKILPLVRGLHHTMDFD